MKEIFISGELQLGPVVVKDVSRYYIFVGGEVPWTSHRHIEESKTGYYRTEITRVNTMKSERTYVTAKNVGKSNEMTPGIVAYTHAIAKLKKYQEKHVSTVNLWFPMLAKTSNDVKIVDTATYMAQPKYDGVRCLAMKETKNGNVKLWTRHGKLHGNDLTHIKRELSKFMELNIIYDGELYSHTLKLQEIVGLVRREESTEQVKDIQFIIYDTFKPVEDSSIDETPFVERYRRISALPTHTPRSVEIICKAPNVEILGSETTLWLNKFLKLKFEGLILRNPMGFYTTSKTSDATRSSQLIKVKTKKDMEFTIVGYTNGKGKASNQLIWKCKTQDGIEFNVVPLGTAKTRETLLADISSGKMPRTEWFNQYLNVQYEALSNNGVPLRAQGVYIRNNE